MNRYILGITFAAGLCSLAFAPAARAGVGNHRTKVEFTEPIEVPGKVLPAGTYTFQLMDSQSDRHLVQIWNANQSELEGTFLTVPDKRLKGRRPHRDSIRGAVFGIPRGAQSMVLSRCVGRRRVCVPSRQGDGTGESE